jgi:hypothetical protein
VADEFGAIDIGLTNPFKVAVVVIITDRYPAVLFRNTQNCPTLNPLFGIVIALNAGFVIL